MKADSDVIAVIDSILAEAGDERAPLLKTIGVPLPHVGLMLPFDTVQGWIDRLRGIRAALMRSEP